jgi:hypothetical protein
MPPILINQPAEIKELKHAASARGEMSFEPPEGEKLHRWQNSKDEWVEVGIERGEVLLHDPKFLIPQTGKFWPLIKLAFSEARNATMSAISSGFPNRSNPDDFFIRSKASAGKPFKKPGVSMGPGETQLIWIP